MSISASPDYDVYNHWPRATICTHFLTRQQATLQNASMQPDQEQMIPYVNRAQIGWPRDVLCAASTCHTYQFRTIKSLQLSLAFFFPPKRYSYAEKDQQEFVGPPHADNTWLKKANLTHPEMHAMVLNRPISLSSEMYKAINISVVIPNSQHRFLVFRS